MQLSYGLIEKFRALHLEKYGEVISYNDAEFQLKEIAELVRITSKKEEERQNENVFC